MACVTEYINLTTKWTQERGGNVAVLYQNGKFFEIYALKDKKTGEISGSKIQEISQICDLKIAERNITVDGKHALQSGFQIDMLDKYLKKLQDAGFIIPVYEQVESEKGTFKRELMNVVSPGTYWSNETEVLSNVTTCVWLYKTNAIGRMPEKIVMGMSSLDIYTGKSTIFENSIAYQHDPATYDEMERYISINNPAEIIIVHNLSDEIVEDIIKFTNIQCNSLTKINVNMESDLAKTAEKCEKQNYQHEIVKHFFPAVNDEIFFENYQNNVVATQSFCFLLDFIQKHNPVLINKISPPVFEKCADTLILANHSLSQLNIIEDGRVRGKLSSVLTFLNNCVTNMGKRRFNYELLNPIKDVDKLNKLYDITEHILNKKTWETYRKLLQVIKDLQKLTRKIIIKKATPKDIAIIAHSINSIISLYDKVSKDKTLLKFLNTPTILANCHQVHELIDTNFDIHKAEHINEFTAEGLSGYSVEQLSFIKKGVCEAVDSKIKEYVDSRDKFECIRDYLSSLIQAVEKKTAASANTQYIKIHETAKSDDCLLGTKRRINILKTQITALANKKIILQYNSSFDSTTEQFELDISGLEYRQNGNSDSNQIVTSSQIRQISSSIQTVKSSIVREIMVFYNSFINELSELEETFNTICEFITKMDTLQNRCYLANKYNYCKPQIEKRDKSFIEFEGIRHCLIEHIQTRELYVTNDLNIGKDVNGYLIYGTNAVGKTSLIRSIGVSLIMAQAGLYVPCTKFLYSPYSYLFTRIIGNDNLFKGQSTFAVEMSELRTILNMADKNSLILGDELCSGTEQGSATSIFCAGLEHLDKLNSSYIFATHFHEITGWSEITDLENLKMMHMTVFFDQQTKKLIYDRKLKEGPGKNMYGLEVCKALRLPDAFLTRAHEIRMKYFPETANTTSFKGSHYNSKKIKGLCELCNINIGEDIHHLQHQKYANNEHKGNKYISHGSLNFHKNHMANLITVCKECHDRFHETDKQFVRVKTSEGYEVVEK